MEGTESPISFAPSDVMAWLLALPYHLRSGTTLNYPMPMQSEMTLNYLSDQTETGVLNGEIASGSRVADTVAPRANSSFVLSTTSDLSRHMVVPDRSGSINLGRLRWGSQGPTPRVSVQDGYLLVRVDRHGSQVGNPFIGAPIIRLCKAYDELLQSMLTWPLSVEECLREYEGSLQDVSPVSAVLLTPFEKALLQRLAVKHSVSIHEQCVRPLALRGWLVFHALLLLRGRSLSLHCWCACGAMELPSWSCHGQSLMGALLWLAHILRVQPTTSLQSTTDTLPCLQVNLFSVRLLSFALLRYHAYLHAPFLPLLLRVRPSVVLPCTSFFRGGLGLLPFLPFLT
jgi:hypothetical protein